MTIEEAIKAHLVAQAAITARVAGRIYQGARQQSVSGEAIAFDEIAGGESLQDLAADPCGLGVRSYQFDCYAATNAAAASLRELVRLAFQGQTGILGGAGGLRVYSCIVTGFSGGYDPDTNTPVRSIDIEFSFDQPTA